MTNINYDKSAFILICPPSKVVSTHRIKNRQEHAKLVEAAKNQHLLLYYSHVIKKGNKFYTDEPLIVDEETAESYLSNLSMEHISTAVEIQQSTPSTNYSDPDDQLTCPFCHKKMTSTPGRTLHIKHKHPDRLKEYKDML